MKYLKRIYQYFFPKIEIKYCNLDDIQIETILRNGKIVGIYINEKDMEKLF
jgi:hypothetical protein